MFKNVASKVDLLVIDASTNLPKTGDAANLTAYVRKDYGSVTVLTDTSATEIDATNAPGLYSFDTAQAETNADKLLFSGKSTTANVRIIPKEVTTVDIARQGITRMGTAQSATGTTLVLDTGATFADDVPIGSTLWAYGSTQGYWQSRPVTDYVLSTDTATVPTWNVTPSGTITFILFGSAPGTGVAQTGDVYPLASHATYGLAALEARTLTAAAIAKLIAHLSGVATVLVTSGSTTTTVNFNTTTGINGAAPSSTNNRYKDRVLIFLTGAMVLEGAAITSYNGTTKIATVATMTGSPASGDTAMLV